MCLAGEDFDRNLGLPNIDFGTYVDALHFNLPIPADSCITAYVSSIVVRMVFT